MKKILSILICVCIIMFSFIACCSDTAKAEVEEESRFYVSEEITKQFPDYGFTHIVVDRETNVCYLYHYGGNRAAITVLLDSDGKPLLWEGEDND